MENTNEQTLVPWLSMWTMPRATIQQIVAENPTRFVLVLAAIAGFAQALDRARMRSIGDRLEWPMIFLIAAVGGPIVGIIGLYIGGALLRWTGNWIGGIASSENIRAAIAWSSVPIIWGLALWIPELALFGQELFTTETPKIDANPSLAFLLFGFAAIEITIGIWTLVVFLKSLGQVQGFSAWESSRQRVPCWSGYHCTNCFNRSWHSWIIEIAEEFMSAMANAAAKPDGNSAALHCRR